MDLITGIFLFYVLTTLYVSFLGLFAYFKIKDVFFEDEVGEDFLPGLTVIIPAYNEEKTIADTIRCVKASDYPRDKLEILVMNDCSTDETLKVVKKFKTVSLYSNEKNSGKATTVNNAVKKAKHEFIAIIDADSFPEPDAFREMMKFFRDEKVGAVTGAILVRNKNTLLEKIQAMEYVLIAWSRKLLDSFDSVFVTPGALSCYRKKAWNQIGGLDTSVLTEDIEIAWNLLKNGWTVRMAPRAPGFTEVPSSYKAWYRQRIRWDVGGFQTLAKHWDALGKTKFNMFGIFVVPFFLTHLLISFSGFFVAMYMVLEKVYNWIIFTTLSIETQSAILDFSEIHLLPDVFTFFAVLLIFLFGISIFFSLRTMKRAKIKIDFSFVIYSLFYLAVFPILLIISLYLWKRGYSKW